MNEERFLEIRGNAETQALSGIWSQLQHDAPFFTDRRELFLYVVDRLLREEHIKLHKDAVLLEGNVHEQVEAFRRAFPANEAASGYEEFYWWFFDDECPAGVAWRKPDGGYQIAE